MAKLKKSSIMKILSLCLALVFVLGAFTGCGGKGEEETTTQAPVTQPTTKAEPVIVNPLTGEANYDEALVKNRPVFISVENHPDARPQWGLTSSDIVWEMVTEGGITRMLLMYADYSRIPEKVGPTRSARHYFIDLVDGFDGIFVHFGGSEFAYDALDNTGLDHIDGMTDSSYFFRDSSRGVSSEHTAYTTDEAIAKAIENKEIRTTLEEGYESPFKFKAKARKLSGGDCNSVVVSFSSGYTYTYTYDEQKKVYLSSLNGNNFVDSEGTQQNFENIIICYTNVSPIPGDYKNRVNIALSEGEGVYVSNGTYMDIKWEKGDSSDMMKFFNAEGKELALNPGRTYIAIVDDGRASYNTIS